MGELGNFLYGQKVVRPILKQFFRCPFFTVKELHDVQVGAVHAGAVLQLIYGIAPSIEAKASLAPSFVGKGKGVSFRAGSGWFSSSFFVSASGVTETDCFCSICAAEAGTLSSRMSS